LDRIRSRIVASPSGATESALLGTRVSLVPRGVRNVPSIVSGYVYAAIARSVCIVCDSCMVGSCCIGPFVGRCNLSLASVPGRLNVILPDELTMSSTVPFLNATTLAIRVCILLS